MKALLALLAAAVGMLFVLNVNATGCNGCMPSGGMTVGVEGQGGSNMNMWYSGQTTAGKIDVSGAGLLTKDVTSTITGQGQTIQNAVSAAQMIEYQDTSVGGAIWGQINQGMNYSFKDVIKSIGCTDQSCFKSRR